MILEDSKKKALIKKLDDIIDWRKIVKNPIVGTVAEMVQNPALKWGLNYLDDNYGDEIPLKYKDDINKLIDRFIADDYRGMLNIIPELGTDIVDIPGLDEDLEGKVIAINFQAIVEIIKYYAIKGKK